MMLRAPCSLLRMTDSTAPTYFALPCTRAARVRVEMCGSGST